MPDAPYIFPALGAVYQFATPWAEAVLRVWTGLALVPHGARIAFGVFKDSGVPIHSLGMMRRQLDASGYRPGWLWAPAIVGTELIAGPLLAVGAFTRAAALPIVVLLIMSNVPRWKNGGYFYDTKGMEYTLLWAAAALYFLARGGGPISFDHAVLGWQF